jgi:restriction endonuclease S subunit
MSLLIDGFTGSVLKNLSKNYLINLQIPIPKSKAKIQAWVDKISAPYNERNAKKSQIKELEL